MDKDKWFNQMKDRKLTRENINFQLTGLGMQLRYLRDALMCTFMEVPVNYFFELRGDLPVSMGDTMRKHSIAF